MNTFQMPQKGISWVDILLSIEVDEERPFPLGKASSIRPRISRDVKFLAPEREFETTKDGDTLIVKRIK